MQKFAISIFLLSSSPPRFHEKTRVSTRDRTPVAGVREIPLDHSTIRATDKYAHIYKYYTAVVFRLLTLLLFQQKII